MQEQRIDDDWNVGSSKHLSDSWRGFTRFTLLKERPLKGYMWSGRRLTKIQATARPENLWPGVWTKIGKGRSEEREAIMGKREAKTRQCANTEENLLYRS